MGARSAPAQSGGPVTLNLLLWEHWKVAEGLQKSDPTNVPKRRLWFYETIKRFEAEHKEIKLQYQTANWNVATQTFIAASQAGNPPDIVGAQSQDNQPLANAGFVADLGQFKYDEWDDFNQAVLREACSVGGKIVAMPVYLTSTGLGYIKPLLKEAGFAEPPKTWDELDPRGQGPDQGHPRDRAAQPVGLRGGAQRGVDAQPGVVHDADDPLARRRHRRQGRQGSDRHSRAPPDRQAARRTCTTTTRSSPPSR